MTLHQGIGTAHRDIGLLTRHLAALIERQPMLARFGIALWGCALLSSIGLLLDERTIDGANVWLKPMKFQLSVGLFALTAAWFLGELPETQRRGRAAMVIVWVVLATGAFEVLYITLQGALGDRSHFNVADPVHAALYTAMGIGAVLLTATTLPLAWLHRRHADRSLAPAYRLGVVLGLTVTGLLGILSGAIMGERLTHAVGGAQSTPGLPLFGWSYTVGDLRVAHFFAIHAEQVLPLAALLVLALWPRRALAGMAALSLLYVALIVAVLVQALAGLPFLAL